MYKYEMDPASIVEVPSTDRWADGQGETSIPLSNFIEVGGI